MYERHLDERVSSSSSGSVVAETHSRIEGHQRRRGLLSMILSLISKLLLISTVAGLVWVALLVAYVSGKIDTDVEDDAVQRRRRRRLEAGNSERISHASLMLSLSEREAEERAIDESLGGRSHSSSSTNDASRPVVDQLELDRALVCAQDAPLLRRDTSAAECDSDSGCPNPAVSPRRGSGETNRSSQSSPLARCCCVCMYERATVLVLPCRHVCLCETCARVCERKASLNTGDAANPLAECPLCRETVESHLVIYV